MRSLLTLVISGAVAGPALAGNMTVTIEIPRLNVVEYHRPYVAAWIEGEDRKLVANLATWYAIDLPKKEGETWLKDLRQWWRKSGRSLEMPVDGVSGPTQPAGEHSLSFTKNAPQLADLAPGNYTLVVEAAREVGGREMLSIPFAWPLTEANLSATGESELSTVKLDFKP